MKQKRAIGTIVVVVIIVVIVLVASVGAFVYLGSKSSTITSSTPITSSTSSSSSSSSSSLLTSSSLTSSTSSSSSSLVSSSSPSLSTSTSSSLTSSTISTSTSAVSSSASSSVSPATTTSTSIAVNATTALGVDSNSSLPQYQTNTFWVNDTRMVSWENISNIQPQGATVTWNWISPNGVSYTNASTTIPTSSGGYSWFVVYGYIPIRNQRASTLPGSWQIIVDFNGAQIALQNFTIQSSRLPSPLTIENSTLSTGVNTTTDAPVNITSSFSNTSPAVYSWLNFTNVPRPEQNVTWTFIMPNGTLYLNQITYMTTDPGALGQWPYWTAYAYSSINGYLAANVPGAWKVDVYIDGRPSLVQNFTIS